MTDTNAKLTLRLFLLCASVHAYRRKYKLSKTLGSQFECQKNPSVLVFINIPCLGDVRGHCAHGHGETMATIVCGWDQKANLLEWKMYIRQNDALIKIVQCKFRLKVARALYICIDIELHLLGTAYTVRSHKMNFLMSKLGSCA